VDQISPPFRIALLALLAVCALWFTVLKPKAPAADAPASTAPGVTGLANDVSAAKGAAAASDAANAKVQAATGGTSATPATQASGTHAAAAAAKKGAAAPPAKKAKTASTDPSAPLLTAVDAKKAVVLLFWNRKAADDRAVREAVDATARRHGKVVVKVVPIGQVARYRTITRDAEVLQSPTTLVIGPGRKARAIVGLTSTTEVDQAVGTALDAK
jgi:hypothetical protein